jgi:hypothetical protein
MRRLPCRDAAVREYLAGAGVSEVCARHGCSRASRRKWVWASGRAPRRCGQRPRPLPPTRKLYAMRFELGSWRKVAKSLGCNVSVILRRANGDVVA